MNLLEKSLKEYEEKFLELAEEFRQNIAKFQKQLDDANWFLGEEKAKNSQLESRIFYLEQKIKELETECYRLQKERDEANWYLGEERARRQELERKLNLIN